MRTATTFRYSVFKLFVQPLKGHSLLMIIFSAMGGSLFTFLIKLKGKEWAGLIVKNYDLLFLIIPLVLSYYLIFEREKTLKIRLSKDNIRENWKSYEKRKNLAAIADYKKVEKAIHLTFMAVPFIYEGKDFFNFVKNNDYGFEFRSKILNLVFAWCINVNINDNEAEGYMFQYDPFNKLLRPHLITGLDVKNDYLIFVPPNDSPEEGHNILQSQHVELVKKNGWYSVRTEVYHSTNVSSSEDPNQKGKLKNNKGEVIEYRKGKSKKSIEIKIFDLNNNGEEIYHNIFTEPPYQVYDVRKIGFRNCNNESALYKDIKIIDLGVIQENKSDK